ncbi:ABC transporter permease [Halobacillus litoralis]|uniref:ABC transporter permease n=1 Tax=Halobacillus litoralis TaxID=45668 RepID=UPI001CD77549|nr:ABC transporter permease [Halobacillus litoralis]MCA0971075.1 ABC transporter permease [Halobacillus litoralis]
MKNLLQSEWLKIKKTRIWWLIIISPILAGIACSAVPIPGELGWLMLLSIGGSIHALLFLPLMVAVFAAFVCRYEHQHNGWKQLFSMPVKRGRVFLAKYLTVLGFVFANQVIFTSVVIGVGLSRGIEGEFPVDMFLRSFFGGWLATLPLAALTLWVAVVWSSFAAAVTVNVILTMPNLLIVNSETIAPLYPWAQPFLMMLPPVEDSFAGFIQLESLLVAILGGLVVFFIGGLVSIQRKAV